MELTNFLKLLYKHRFTLIAVPLFAMGITYYLTRKLPKVYVSKARIAAGIVGQNQKRVLDNQDFSQDSKISQQFSNIMEIMQMKRILDQVSYQLMLHDLTDKYPFRKPSKLLSQLNKSAREHAINVYTDLYRKKESLSLFDNDQNGLNRVLVSMRYDDESLLSKLLIYRVSNSDFIDLTFESENPDLSAFVLNTLCNEFISYYTALVRENQFRTINFLDSLVNDKRDSINNKVLELKNYKIGNGILNLSEQAKSVYAQISDFETKKELAEKDINAYTGAIQNIEEKFDPKDRRYLESTLTRINQDILSTKESLRLVTDEYVKSNYDNRYLAKIDSLKNVLTLQINQSTDKVILNPLATKQSLITQKINLEISLDLAKYSVGSLTAEIQKLKERFDKLVPHEAVIQSYERSIDIKSREYLEILYKFNQANLDAKLNSPVQEIEIAMPGYPKASKAMLLVLLSGAVSFVFYAAILFVLFYLDNSVKTAKELADKTNMPVLGFLPLIHLDVIDLKTIWGSLQRTPKIKEYKTLLRSLRFEIDSEIQQGAKTIVITSTKPGEGKTFISLGLMYAFAIGNKKILLIDGNFDHPSISLSVETSFYLEDYLSGKLTLQGIKNETGFTVLANRGGDISLFELLDEKYVQNKLGALKNLFDIILIESPSLDELNKAKEWITVADKTVVVFEAVQSINETRQQQVNYLKTPGGKCIGWIMNRAETGKTKNK